MLSLIPASAGLALLAPHGLVHYFKSHFGDIRINGFGFKGLYRLNGFDVALLVPYFLVLLVLNLRIDPAADDVLHERAIGLAAIEQ